MDGSGKHTVHHFSIVTNFKIYFASKPCYYDGKGNGIYVSISKYGSDTPVTRPETDKAGLSSRDRKRGGGLKCY